MVSILYYYHTSNHHSPGCIISVLRKRLFYQSLPYRASSFPSSSSLLLLALATTLPPLLLESSNRHSYHHLKPREMATSKYNHLIPYNSHSSIHPSSMAKHSTPIPLVPSPVSPKSTVPCCRMQLCPSSYTYTSSPGPLSKPQPLPQTLTQIHSPHSLKRSHSSISLDCSTNSPINRFYPKQKRIRTHGKAENQDPPRTSSGHSKDLATNQSTHGEDTQEEEDEQTREDEKQIALRQAIKEYCSSLHYMEETIEGALRSFGWDPDMDRAGLRIGS